MGDPVVRAHMKRLFERRAKVQTPDGAIHGSGGALYTQYANGAVNYGGAVYTQCANGAVNYGGKKAKKAKQPKKQGGALYTQYANGAVNYGGTSAGLHAGAKKKKENPGLKRFNQIKKHVREMHPNLPMKEINGMAKELFDREK